MPTRESTERSGEVRPEAIARERYEAQIREDKARLASLADQIAAHAEQIKGLGASFARFEGSRKNMEKQAEWMKNKAEEMARDIQGFYDGLDFDIPEQVQSSIEYVKQSIRKMDRSISEGKEAWEKIKGGTAPLIESGAKKKRKDEQYELMKHVPKEGLMRDLWGSKLAQSWFGGKMKDLASALVLNPVVRVGYASTKFVAETGYALAKETPIVCHVTEAVGGVASALYDKVAFELNAEITSRRPETKLPKNFDELLHKNVSQRSKYIRQLFKTIKGVEGNQAEYLKTHIASLKAYSVPPEMGTRLQANVEHRIGKLSSVSKESDLPAYFEAKKNLEKMEDQRREAKQELENTNSTSRKKELEKTLADLKTKIEEQKSILDIIKLKETKDQAAGLAQNEVDQVRQLEVLLGHLERLRNADSPEAKQAIEADIEKAIAAGLRLSEVFEDKPDWNVLEEQLGQRYTERVDGVRTVVEGLDAEPADNAEAIARIRTSAAGEAVPAGIASAIEARRKKLEIDLRGKIIPTEAEYQSLKGTKDFLKKKIEELNKSARGKRKTLTQETKKDLKRAQEQLAAVESSIQLYEQSVSLTPARSAAEHASEWHETESAMDEALEKLQRAYSRIDRIPNPEQKQTFTSAIDRCKQALTAANLSPEELQTTSLIIDNAWEALQKMEQTEQSSVADFYITQAAFEDLRSSLLSGSGFEDLKKASQTLDLVLRTLDVISRGNDQLIETLDRLGGAPLSEKDSESYRLLFSGYRAIQAGEASGTSLEDLKQSMVHLAASLKEEQAAAEQMRQNLELGQKISSLNLQHLENNIGQYIDAPTQFEWKIDDLLQRAATYHNSSGDLGQLPDALRQNAYEIQNLSGQIADDSIPFSQKVDVIKNIDFKLQQFEYDVLIEVKERDESIEATLSYFKDKLEEIFEQQLGGEPLVDELSPQAQELLNQNQALMQEFKNADNANTAKDKLEAMFKNLLNLQQLLEKPESKVTRLQIEHDFGTPPYLALAGNRFDRRYVNHPDAVRADVERIIEYLKQDQGITDHPAFAEMLKYADRFKSEADTGNAQFTLGDKTVRQPSDPRLLGRQIYNINRMIRDVISDPEAKDDKWSPAEPDLELDMTKAEVTRPDLESSEPGAATQPETMEASETLRPEIRTMRQEILQDIEKWKTVDSDFVTQPPRGMRRDNAAREEYANAKMELYREYEDTMDALTEEASHISSREDAERVEKKLESAVRWLREEITATDFVAPKDETLAHDHVTDALTKFLNTLPSPDSMGGDRKDAFEQLLSETAAINADSESHITDETAQRLAELAERITRDQPLTLRRRAKTFASELGYFETVPLTSAERSPQEEALYQNLSDFADNLAFISAGGSEKAAQERRLMDEIQALNPSFESLNADKEAAVSFIKGLQKIYQDAANETFSFDESDDDVTGSLQALMDQLNVSQDDVSA